MTKQKKIKKLWDQNTDNYDKHMEDTGHYKAQHVLFNLLKNNFKSPTLDLASGPGFLASILLKKKFYVTLNDFSIEMQKLSKELFGHYKNAKFSNQDANNFIFKNKFKTIISCNLFYYLQDRDNAIKHWEKYLDKDGMIILFEEYPFKKPKTKEMEKSEKELMSLVDPLSPKQIKEIFIKNKFKLIEEKSVPIDKKHDLFGFVFKKN